MVTGPRSTSDGRAWFLSGFEDLDLKPGCFQSIVTIPRTCFMASSHSDRSLVDLVVAASGPVIRHVSRFAIARGRWPVDIRTDVP